MAIERFIDHLRSSPDYDGQIAVLRVLAERDASHAEPQKPLPDALRAGLAASGIDHLYTHQASALDALREGKDIVVVTGTASGKTLCYNLPVFETLLEDPSAKALYLFPTKALAQDQLRGITRLADAIPKGLGVIRAACYDGDTPSHQRAKIKREAQIILSNPDMLHTGILPYHSKWARFFSDLRYVVLDEVHTCRGIFGSNIANVLRRLERICAHYGGSPQFICCSATIANPAEIARDITGREMTLIDNDGSPKGRKYFLLWNPPLVEGSDTLRRSANVQAQRLLADLVSQGIQTIVFTRARVLAEIIYRYTKDYFLDRKSPLADRLRSYRGGYLAEDRRKIEQELFKGEALGVVSTNALELGIDIGGLDACVIVGYPGTLASTWQQAGRAGRSSEESLVIFIGTNDPIDQFLIRHPDYVFGRSPEHAVIDPSNPYILFNHLRCAAFEIPLTAADDAYFGPLLREIAELIEESGDAKRIDGKTYWSSSDFPAGKVSLRTVSDDTYSIIDRSSGKPVTIGVVDSASAPEIVYDEAVYLHDGETYLVENLDTQNHIAYVKRATVDYYTRPNVSSSLRVLEMRDSKTLDDSQVCLGDACVEWQTVSFTRQKFYTLENIGTVPLDLPAQQLNTTAAWLIPSPRLHEALRDEGCRPMDALAALRNMILVTLPMLAMCDRRDIAALVDSRNTGVPTVFFYDRYPGGLGFAEKGYEMAGELLKQCLTLVTECPCERGCPSCVGAPKMPAGENGGNGGYSPDKGAAVLLLRRWLG